MHLNGKISSIKNKLRNLNDINKKEIMKDYLSVWWKELTLIYPMPKKRKNKQEISEI